MRSPWPFGLIGCASVLVGCGAPTIVSGSPTSSPVLAPSTTTSANSTSVSEWDSYPAGSIIDRVLLKGDTFTQVEGMVQVAIGECMSAAGFTPPPVPTPHVGGEDLTRSLAEIAQDRSKHGYGISTLNPEANTGPREQASKLYLEALGDESGGCTREAQQKIFPAFPFYQGQFDWVSAAFDQALSADSRLAAAWGDWAKCMRRDGYNVSYSNDAKAAVEKAFDDALRNGQSSTSVQAFEIAVATSDTSCYRGAVQPVKIRVEKEILDSWVADGKLPAELWPLPAQQG